MAALSLVPRASAPWADAPAAIPGWRRRCGGATICTRRLRSSSKTSLLGAVEAEHGDERVADDDRHAHAV